MTVTATYSPEDNKLRLYPAFRLDAETYARVKAVGFKWAPQQELFVAPMWTPERAALCEELAGSIGDEDTSLVERSEERAGRFDQYSDNRRRDSENAAAAVKALADGIPLGQPILVGHHSEKHARRDAKRIENGMRKAVKMWETAAYWKDRAAGALRAAKYKERPDVRQRRIKGLEADQRKQQRGVKEADQALKLWGKLHEPDSLKRKDGTPTTFKERAVFISGHTNTTPFGVYSDLTADKITPEEAQRIAIESATNRKAHCEAWLTHIAGRLVYERAMLAEIGGTPAQQTGPQVGGACKCWASPRGGWSYITKVNKVSVTVLDNWGNGGKNFTRTIPFDKLSAIMTPVEVEMQRETGALVETDDKTGFILKTEFLAARAKPVEKEAAPDVDAMRASLKAGVTVAAVPQLFPTPREIAEQMAALAEVGEGCEVLEPSAGTGSLLGAIGARWHDTGGRAVAVEINGGLCDRLRTEFPLTDVRCADFLQCNGDLGKFDRIIMNPPFEKGSDLKHILHARKFLKPGGRLVALCANGPLQQATLKELAEESGGSYDPLPQGSFKTQGTNVNVALLVIEQGEP